MEQPIKPVRLESTVVIGLQNRRLFVLASFTAVTSVSRSLSLITLRSQHLSLSRSHFPLSLSLDSLTPAAAPPAPPYPFISRENCSLSLSTSLELCLQLRPAPVVPQVAVSPSVAARSIIPPRFHLRLSHPDQATARLLRRSHTRPGEELGTVKSSPFVVNQARIQIVLGEFSLVKTQKNV
ncbi:hypothetical protein Csa_001142 [Cucumis sativus]|uniref:Uncharacterized protein n=1 Tax=Cucumis sativus TaxID=3659 RepID=A0A0A0LFK0_CUCSA|nr:hypothetical protein Csa_001142 [Cucumis sativus]